MPRVTVNSQSIDVPDGTTVLDAARRLGIDIPALCHYDALPPNMSCMLCVVEIEGRNGVVPACAHPVEDGMIVETETPGLFELRRQGLALLLSDHVGDCRAPCQHTCPVGMDVPAMLRQVQEGDLRGAITTIRADMALPSVLGRVCPELCERTCRRAVLDQPAAICRVKQFVADKDLEEDEPCLPEVAPSTGKRVAIVGAGPAGLSAAYHLALAGHGCTVMDAASRAGGRLRIEYDDVSLPRSVIDAEIGVIEHLGVEVQSNTSISDVDALDSLVQAYDAVLLAVGRLLDDQMDVFGLEVTRGRIRVESQTHQTSRPGVFAAGDAVSPTDLVVQCVAQGKRAAAAIDAFLAGGVQSARLAEFNVRTKTPAKADLVEWLCRPHDTDAPRLDVEADLQLDDIQGEAARCLGCDCMKRDGCLLRQYAAQYDVVRTPAVGDRRTPERHAVGPEVYLEPGKCINCGICVGICEAVGEPNGMTFLHRGFDTRIDLPIGTDPANGLRVSARRCIDACPTGALLDAQHLQGNLCTMCPDSCS